MCTYSIGASFRLSIFKYSGIDCAKVELRCAPDSEFFKLSEHVHRTGKTHIKVQHSQVKVTFHLLPVQHPWFHCLGVCGGGVPFCCSWKNHCSVDSAIHLNNNQACIMQLNASKVILILRQQANRIPNVYDKLHACLCTESTVFTVQYETVQLLSELSFILEWSSFKRDSVCLAVENGPDIENHKTNSIKLSRHECLKRTWSMKAMQIFLPL